MRPARLDGHAEPSPDAGPHRLANLPALHPELDDADSRRNGLEEYLQKQIDSGVTEKAELLVIALKRLRDSFSESGDRSN